MIHAAQQMVGIEHDLMAAFALDVGYKADSTAVMFLIGSIEARCRWPAGAFESLRSLVSRSHDFPWRSRRAPLLVAWYCRIRLHEPVSECCSQTSRSGEALAGRRSNPVPTDYYMKRAIAESI
jgi:hypothetical protein